MRITRQKVAAAAIAACLAAVPALANAGQATGATAAPATHRPTGSTLRVVGLTDAGQLVSFASSDPGRVRSLGKVQGLVGDVGLVGIDYRVQDGYLYGVGDAGGIYTLNPRGRVSQATLVSRLSVPLAGTAFGVDFNPAANRLRVVSNTGQNLRHNLDDPAGTPPAGTTASDTSLTYPGPPVVPATGVTAAAYTNNDLDAATATTLFDLDTVLDQVVVQSPANAGLLAPTGKLGVDAGAPAGFDIDSRQSQGSTVGNAGFATLSVSGQQTFHRVDLLTGRVTPVGSFPADRQVVDIAIPLAQR
jgi:Domain of unknown function (DUF4394)